MIPQVVKSLDGAEKNPRAIDNWIQSISDIHRSRPPPNVHYTKWVPYLLYTCYVLVIYLLYTRYILVIYLNPRAIDNWIQSISDIHRSRPPPNVHYTKWEPYSLYTCYILVINLLHHCYIPGLNVWIEQYTVIYWLYTCYIPDLNVWIKNPRVLDNWIQSISDIHRSRPPPNIQRFSPIIIQKIESGLLTNSTIFYRIISFPLN